jgi:hypothetical protein
MGLRIATNTLLSVRQPKGQYTPKDYNIYQKSYENFHLPQYNLTILTNSTLSYVVENFLIIQRLYDFEVTDFNGQP